MKSLLLALAVAVGATSIGLASFDAQAKRLGGGKAAGMQRQAPAKSADANTGTPATPAAQPGAQPGGPSAAVAGAAAAPAAAAAAAGKRSWMGPLAGLAAGIGLAALFSHLGMGEGLANVVMMVLLALVAFAVIRFLMARFGSGNKGGLRGGNAGGLQMAGAGAPLGAGFNRPPVDERPATAMQRETLAPAANQASHQASSLSSSPAMGAAAAAAPLVMPAGLDAADFARLAKQVFIRLQAANDAGDVEDLRRFTTPELFASLRTDLLERGSAKQQTDVVQLDAEVVEAAQDGGRDVVSVRFHGLIRELAESGAEPFNELWHLVRPSAGGDWAIAGITPLQ